MAKLDKQMLEFLFVGPLFSVFKELKAIKRKLGDMATQAEVNALADQVGAIGNQLTKGFGEVNQEIASLRDQVAAGQPVDLTVLQQKVDALVPVAQGLDDIVPDATEEPEEPSGETPVDPEPVEPEPVSEPVDESATPEDSENV